MRLMNGLVSLDQELCFIHNLMNKLKTNKNRTDLCKETDLAPTIGNETRWASAGNMMNKYEKIETAVIE